MPGLPPDERYNTPRELKAYFSDLFAWMREKVGVDMNEVLKDDDWMLVVKLHAMIESALNIALVLELREPRLETVIGKLPTSDGSTGKVAFANALEMLEKPSVDFLRYLSTLRNFCVHNIRNFKFDLVRHLAEHEKAHELRGAMIKGMEFGVPRKDKKAIAALVDSDPRLALFGASFGIMMQLHVHNEKCRGRDLTEEGYRLKAARLDEIEPRRSTPTE